MKNRNEDLPNPPPLEHISAIDHILHHDAVAAVLLLIAAASAFVLANCPFMFNGRSLFEWYEGLWHLQIGTFFNGSVISKSLHHLVNDGLMAIFFFVVGLEIKRELMVGELASVRKAMLPIVAAIGGMVCPAVVYSLLNFGKETAIGWGIPMATDIAFAAGVLGILSKKVPASLAVFLIALAIVDDLGSVTVIALFYSDGIAMRPLFVGLGLIGLSFIIAKLGVRNAWVFIVMAAIIWVEFFQSGVHATIAGVLFAFTIPVDARYETPLFIQRVNALLHRFRDAEDHVNPLLVNERQQQIVRAFEEECIHVEAPLQRIEHKLHPICAFLIMPVFAFANSGVHLDFGNIGPLLNNRVTVGVILGLLVGKQVGIMSACWVAVKAGWADLPKGVKWIQLYGVTWLAGIGFTMSLFIGSLAFQVSDPTGHAAASSELSNTQLFLSCSKMGTLIASIIAGISGALILILSAPKNTSEEI